MSEKLKKIGLIILFAASVIGIGTGIYFAFFRQVIAPPAEEVIPEEEVTPGLPTSPEAGERPDVAVEEEVPAELSLADTVARGGVTQTTSLTQSAVSATVLSGDGKNMNYYDPSDGRFYKVDDEGNVVALSDSQFPNAESVEWNNNSDKAVIEFPDGSNVVYNFTTQQQVTLPQHWEDFEFSPSSDEIVAKSIAIDPDNRWLVTTNSDGSNVKAIAALGENADKVTVSWSPSDKVIGFADTQNSLSGGFDRKLILPIGKNQENYRGLQVEGLGFLPNWAPDGKKLMYSAAGDFSSNKPMLWIVDATPASMGENRKSLGLNTWADKCTFVGNTTAYCAVPVSLPENAGLQRVLYRDVPDRLYKVDIQKGKTTLAAIPEEGQAMENLSVSSDESTLYYTNSSTGQLESIRLK